jgi:hypothetical protein
MKRTTKREEPKLDVTLSIRDSGLNLPSMDANCMAVLTYLRFINVKAARIETQPQTNQPLITYNDTAEKKKKTISGAKGIIDYIRSQQPPSKYDLDAGLNAKQRSRYNAVMAVVQETLLPAVYYYWWLYGDNYSHSVSPAISEKISIFYKLTTPRALQSNVKKQIWAKFGRNVSKVEIFSMVTKSLEVLSTLLNNKPYFLSTDKYVQYQII